MKADDIQNLIQKKQLEENLRSEFEATIKDRVGRYLEVKPHEIIPNTHSSQVTFLQGILHVYAGEFFPHTGVRGFGRCCL